MVKAGFEVCCKSKKTSCLPQVHLAENTHVHACQRILRLSQRHSHLITASSDLFQSLSISRSSFLFIQDASTLSSVGLSRGFWVHEQAVEGL